MKKLFVLLSLITLCSCGQEKTIAPQQTSFKEEVQEDVQKEDVMSEAEYKDKCKAVTFKELADDKDAMKGDMLTFTGEVIQKRKNADMYRFNVQKRTWGYSETVLFTVDGDVNFKEGDIITLYGESEGMYTYTSSMDVEITAPLMKASYIEVNPLS